MLRVPKVSATRPPEPDVLAPVGADAPGRGISREAGRRIALFVLVVLLAGSAAWGAGRLLGAGMDPVGTTGHDMTGHDMSQMPGMDMTELPG